MKKIGRTIGGTNQAVMMRTFAVQAGVRVPLGRRCLKIDLPRDTYVNGEDWPSFQGNGSDCSRSPPSARTSGLPIAPPARDGLRNRPPTSPVGRATKRATPSGPDEVLGALLGGYEMPANDRARWVPSQLPSVRRSANGGRGSRAVRSPYSRRRPKSYPPAPRFPRAACPLLTQAARACLRRFIVGPRSADKQGIASPFSRGEAMPRLRRRKASNPCLPFRRPQLSAYPAPPSHRPSLRS
jgi:hypothetical protein